MTEDLSTLERLRASAASGSLSRRAVLRRSVALGLSAPVIAGLLAACGGDDDDVEAPATATTASGGSEPEATATTASGGSAPEATATTAPDAPAEERGGDGVLKLLYWQAPVILNVHQANGTKDYHASRVCLEPLADWDINTEPVLFLASEWPSVEAGTLDPEGRWVEWKLREGVKWHDGEDFNAEDVAFTFEYIMDEATASTTSGRYSTIDNVEIIDDYTVRVNFKDVTPAWYDPFVTTEGIILPEHQFRDSIGAESRASDANLKPVGTGPFMVTEFRPGDVVLYDIFPDYWDPGKPKIDQVEMKGGGDATGAARAVLQSGEYDWAWNLQIEPAVLNEMLGGGIGDLSALPNGGTERLMFNFADPNTEVDGAFSEPSTTHPIFSDVRARKAISLAIQRDVIAEQLYGPGGLAASNQYDEPAKFTNPDLTWEFDLEKAKALLDEMGYEGGYNILYQTSINSVRQKTQEIIKSALEQLGFSMEIKAIDAAVYFSTDPGNPDTSGKFYADFEMHTNGAGVYPSVWFERYRTDEIANKANGWTGGNYFRYSNPEFDAMHDQVRIETDEAEQTRLYKEMMTLVTDTDVVEIPIVNRTSLAAKSLRIKGFSGSPWASTPVWELKELRLDPA